MGFHASHSAQASGNQTVFIADSLEFNDVFRPRQRLAVSFVTLALLTAGAGLSAAQCVPSPRSLRIETFATLKAVAKQGEAGSQLRLEETGSALVATLRDYLGGAAS
jgi:hypothetical protein